MKNANIAKVYANTFMELGSEQNLDVAKELTSFTEVINTSNELENVLFLDVFTTEEKMNVFSAIAERINLSATMQAAIKYLIEEKRIGLFPLIFKEIVVADDLQKGFLRGTIEGATSSISEADKEKLISAIKRELGNLNPVLDYKENGNITAGYKVTVGDYQLDATVDNQLKSFKESILGN